MDEGSRRPRMQMMECSVPRYLTYEREVSAVKAAPSVYTVKMAEQLKKPVPSGRGCDMHGYRPKSTPTRPTRSTRSTHARGSALSMPGIIRRTFTYCRPTSSKTSHV